MKADAWRCTGKFLDSPHYQTEPPTAAHLRIAQRKGWVWTPLYDGPVDKIEFNAWVERMTAGVRAVDLPEADCWAILTPNGSKLVPPDEAKGRKDAYRLFSEEQVRELLANHSGVRGMDGEVKAPSDADATPQAAPDQQEKQ